MTNQSDTQTVNSDCNTPTGYQDSDSVTVIYNDFDVVSMMSCFYLMVKIYSTKFMMET